MDQEGNERMYGKADDDFPIEMPPRGKNGERRDGGDPSPERQIFLQVEGEGSEVKSGLPSLKNGVR